MDPDKSKKKSSKHKSLGRILKNNLHLSNSNSGGSGTNNLNNNNNNNNSNKKNSKKNGNNSSSSSSNKPYISSDTAILKAESAEQSPMPFYLGSLDQNGFNQLSASSSSSTSSPSHQQQSQGSSINSNTSYLVLPNVNGEWPESRTRPASSLIGSNNNGTGLTSSISSPSSLSLNRINPQHYPQQQQQQPPHSIHQHQHHPHSHHHQNHPNSDFVQPLGDDPSDSAIFRNPNNYNFPSSNSSFYKGSQKMSSSDGGSGQRRPPRGYGPNEPTRSNSNSSNEEQSSSDLSKHQQQSQNKIAKSSKLSDEAEILDKVESNDEVAINKLFEVVIIDELNLKEDQKGILRSKPLETKRALLLQKLKLSQPKQESSSHSKFKSPSDYATFLSENCQMINSKEMLECVKSLRVELSCKYVSWVKEFGHKQGHIFILNIIKYCNSIPPSKRPSELLLDLISCIQSFMNNAAGFNMVFEHPTAFVTLVQSLDPNLPTLMGKILEMLAVVTLVKHGVERILNAFTDAAIDSNRHERFWIIVEGLSLHRDNISVAISSIQLLNCLITNHDDFEQRFHLRNEIYRTSNENHTTDFRKIAADVERLLQQERISDNGDFELENGRPASITTSVVSNSTHAIASNMPMHKRFLTFFQMFFSSKDEDFDEMANRFENIRFDFDNMDDCYKVLRNSVIDTPVESYFLSILQLLLYIRDDSNVKTSYYLLIEECLMQILFHKSGVDPDFKLRSRFDLDVNLVIDAISKRVRENENAAMNAELNQKLEEALAGKVESEALLQQQQKAVQDLQEQLKKLQANFASAGSTGSPIITPKSSIPPPPPPPPGSIPPPPPPPPGSGIPPPPPPPPPPGSGIPPPPPPPPGSGIPPPPPPPGGGPPPPPPPGGLFFAPPPAEFPFNIKRANFEPKQRMKKPNWKKLTPTKVSEKSIWIEVQSDDTLVSDDLMDSIVQNFAGTALKKDDNKSAANNGTTTDGQSNTKATPLLSKKHRKCRVLNEKTAQNLSILLSALKMGPEDIKRDIVTMNEEHLSENILDQIIHYMPSSDELQRLQALAANTPIEEFHEAEKFAIHLGSIKGLVNRLKSMLFKMKFNESFSEVRKDILDFTMACQEVRKSEKFALVLKLVLSIGNYMNAGSRNARAIGFEISFLPKLVSTKTVDNKSTLLHFIATKIEEKYPEVSKFYEELVHLDKAAKASPENLTKNMGYIRASLKALELDLKNFKSHSPDDQFFTVMTSFKEDAQEKYSRMEGMIKQMETLYTELGTYFAFETKQYTMDECFSDIKTFKDQYVHACAENQQRREQEEKTRRAKEAKEKADKERKVRISNKIDPKNSNPEDQGLMEHLLNSLHSGSAFAQCKRKRAKAVTPQDRRQQLSRSRSRTSLDQSRGISTTPTTSSSVSTATPIINNSRRVEF